MIQVDRKFEQLSALSLYRKCFIIRNTVMSFYPAQDNQEMQLHFQSSMRSKKDAIRL